MASFVGCISKPVNSADYRVSQLGGSPTFPSPNRGFVCSHCSTDLTFVAQICCPGTHFKIIYIFACNICRNNQFRAYRLLHSPPNDSVTSRAPPNDWMDSFSALTVTPAQKTPRQGSHKPRLIQFSAEKSKTVGSKVGCGDCGTGDHLDEDYERTTPAHGNLSFYKFEKYVRNRPGICVRSEFAGVPKLAYFERILPPNCESCGSSRVFELQLFPAVISLVGSPVPEFMTVIVFTCSSNCASGGVLREYVHVQYEP